MLRGMGVGSVDQNSEIYVREVAGCAGTRAV